ncbi:hypothetical protein DSM104443_01288 [Usitatibacter rugosus]|uniref:Questin oxidase family protein n=1 Tax=Usitatibacter rugosus TaxID=2732067 RepID=A0A6M4GUT1_9PROT|nr:questin oxidase family protein [Usitatibacter rugosus]QJR10234.1 hypothetical protein DSM104443_01288 [Usitatibacter rugosus]
MSLKPSTVARIEAAHRFGAFYRGYLANHLPMALASLDRMGADEATLERFEAQHVETHLEPIGNDPRFAQAVEAFAQRIALEGRDAVLRSTIGHLVTGTGSGAFHGAIRTAFALESGSDREMAHALAYWTLAFEPLPAPPALTGSETPHEVLIAISRDPRFAKHRFPGKNIAERLQSASRDPAFAGLVARVDPAKLSVASIAAAMIRVYAASTDFTMLHGVTGTHAFRLLAPFSSAPALATAQLWQAVVAAYLGAGSPAAEGEALKGSDALAWKDIHARAIRCTDEHDIKLAYSCWEECGHSGDDLYRRVASSVVCHALRETVEC